MKHLDHGDNHSPFPPRILIVEGEEATARHLVKILEEFGYDVLPVVSSAEDAFEKIRALSPDLTLMNISLKGPVAGLEAAEKILASIEIPIVFIVSHYDEKIVEQASRINPVGYILAPYNRYQIKITIETALYTARLAAE
ncbi:MAG: response regulator, partial [Deltaproteobacteria bacterium]|nr:response regulator [Deltaproteobacteria bacterium]